MTDYEKNMIMTLQGKGYGYKRIAKELGLAVNGVKTFCRRHPVSAAPQKVQAVTRCLYCGMEVQQTPKRKVKKFCSDRCRMAWWKDHPDKVCHKKKHHFTCAWCGSAFTSRNPGRIYCSRACYAQARRKGGGGE